MYNTGRRQRILLVADVPNWAFHNNIRGFMPHLKEFDFEVAFAARQNLDMDEVLESFDKVHFMNWLDGVSWCGHEKVSAGVASHNYELRHMAQARDALPRFDALTTTSPLLRDRCRAFNSNVLLIPSGVDLDLFPVQPLPRRRKFVVGWVGQRTSGGISPDDGDIDIKGCQLVLEPLMRRLARHRNIKFLVHSNNHRRAVPVHKMKRIYAKMDCLICTSLLEGTPNPVFEAAACGRPVISTRVGATAELVEHGHNGFLVDAYHDREGAARVVDQLERHLLMLQQDEPLRVSMGRNARHRIECSWSWAERARQYVPLFERDLRTAVGIPRDDRAKAA